MFSGVCLYVERVGLGGGSALLQWGGLVINHIDLKSLLSPLHHHNT